MAPTKEAVAEITVETVAHAIDHMVLAPDHTFQDIEQACRDAQQYGFASLTLAPYAVSYAARLLRGTGMRICGTVGMPLGHCGLKAKCDEAASCIESGAAEIDVLINLVAMKSGRYGDVQEEIAAIRKMATGLTLKATLECCYLTDAEKARAGKLVLDAGADVLKSHTGFGRTGATTRDVLILKRVAGHQAEVEVAGDFRTFKQFHAITQVGAARVATAFGVDVIRDFYKWEAE